MNGGLATPLSRGHAHGLLWVTVAQELQLRWNVSFCNWCYIASTLYGLCIRLAYSIDGSSLALMNGCISVCYSVAYPASVSACVVIIIIVVMWCGRAGPALRMQLGSVRSSSAWLRADCSDGVCCTSQRDTFRCRCRCSHRRLLTSWQPQVAAPLWHHLCLCVCVCVRLCVCVSACVRLSILAIVSLHMMQSANCDATCGHFYHKLAHMSNYQQTFVKKI